MKKRTLKEKYLTPLRIVLAFVMGVVISAVITMKFCTRQFSESKFLKEPAINIVNNLSLLQDLHQKDVDRSIALVDWELDQNILELSIYLRPSNKKHVDKFILAALEQARLYREKYPSRITIPELQRDLNNVLSLTLPKGQYRSFVKHDNTDKLAKNKSAANIHKGAER